MISMQAPRPVGTPGQTDEPGNMLQQMKRRDQRLATLLAQIDSQIARIENSI